jgi:hypothetical protein
VVGSGSVTLPKGIRPLQHFLSMKAILFLSLFLAIALQADEAQDRAAIDKLIAALNDPAKRANLFVKDADSAINFDRLIELHRLPAPSPGAVIGMNESWTQLTAPHVVSERIRFVTQDVATVDGASTIDGAITLARRVPLLFVLKKVGAEWRISVVRVLAAEAVTRPRII